MVGEEGNDHVENPRDGGRHDATTTRPLERSLRVGSTLDASTEQVVTRVMDCAFSVHRHWGPGFKEPIYERALCLEMDSVGLKFECQKAIEVKFRHWRIPGQRVDLIVEQLVLVEIKVVPRLMKLHRSQVLSYLRTLDLRIGLLINFNCSVLKDGFKRVVN